MGSTHLIDVSQAAVEVAREFPQKAVARFGEARDQHGVIQKNASGGSIQSASRGRRLAQAVSEPVGEFGQPVQVLGDPVLAQADQQGQEDAGILLNSRLRHVFQKVIRPALRRAGDPERSLTTSVLVLWIALAP